MGCAEGVVLALGPLGEAGQAATLAERADAVATTGQDLVRVDLMPDVPDDDVLGGLEHVVQGDGELDHAQARTQVAAGRGDGVNGFGAQLVGELSQLGQREAARVGGRVDGIQKRSLQRHRTSGRD